MSQVKLCWLIMLSWQQWSWGVVRDVESLFQNEGESTWTLDAQVGREGEGADGRMSVSNGLTAHSVSIGSSEEVVLAFDLTCTNAVEKLLPLPEIITDTSLMHAKDDQGQCRKLVVWAGRNLVVAVN